MYKSKKEIKNEHMFYIIVLIVYVLFLIGTACIFGILV
jgi:hypothetical protein